MFENLDIFRMSSAMAMHAGQKQAIVAQNVANADTPGYQALDVTDFKETYQPDEATGSQRASRAGHLNGATERDVSAIIFEARGDSSPDGNTVSIETEMLNSTAANSQHDRALAIYKSALNILRSTVRG